MGKRILTIVFATLMAMVTFTACSDNDEHRNDTQTGEEQVDQLIDQLILNIAQMRVNEKNGESFLLVSSKDEAYRFCESLTGEKWDGENRTVTLADAYGTVMLKASSVEGIYGTVIFRDVRHLDDMTLHLADPEFIKNDKHYSQYYEGMYILFKTGMRISEFCGLTLDDIDMENRKIKIDHQLQRTREGVYLIEDTKTTYGERILPMSEGVYQCFQKLIKKRKKWKVDPMIDGKAGFLVLDKNGMPYLANHWEKRFGYALGKYNRTFKEELPNITPHICRHTYCTNMAKSGISPKSLQYLMGHSDIATTLGYYTHYKFNDVEKEVRELEKKLSGE